MINNLAEEHTVIFIAHRFSTVVNADYIIVLNDKKIVGYGTHDVLLKTNHVYQQLYKSEQ